MSTPVHERVKYPRTRHLPWSRSRTDEDEVWADDEAFCGQVVVVTEKLDGENTTIYPGGFSHARSLDSKGHPSRDWVRQLAARLGPAIPPGWRVCGENLYAKHSIFYDALPSYFLIFALYDQDNLCLSWPDTQEWAELLAVPTVPLLFEGPYDRELIHARCYSGVSCYGPVQEGYVIRPREAFPHAEHGRRTGKFVRPRHVQTTDHWLNQPLVPNRLRGTGQT